MNSRNACRGTAAFCASTVISASDCVTTSRNTLLQILTMRASCSSLFFFQAEDGIRGIGVTGVQTCALPICGGAGRGARAGHARGAHPRRPFARSDRKSVVEGKSVDLGGRRIIKRKKKPGKVHRRNSRKQQGPKQTHQE